MALVFSSLEGRTARNHPPGTHPPEVAHRRLPVGLQLSTPGHAQRGPLTLTAGSAVFARERHGWRYARRRKARPGREKKFSIFHTDFARTSAKVRAQNGELECLSPCPTLSYRNSQPSGVGGNAADHPTGTMENCRYALDSPRWNRVVMGAWEWEIHRAGVQPEAAQFLLGDPKADVIQICGERDMTRAAAVAAKIG